LAVPITFVAALAAPGAAGQPPQQRVIVGRYGREPALGPGPLIVDPQTRSVTSAPYGVVERWLFRDESALYWKRTIGALVDGTLYRLGFPDFKEEVAKERFLQLKQGPLNCVVCVTYRGQLHWVEQHYNGPGGYFVAPGIAGPFRRLRGDLPEFDEFLISNHYGLLVYGKSGLFRVEERTP
jgi:hypothetical protein